MKRVALVWSLAATPAAAEWTFSEGLAVDGDAAAGVFAHLESAGRRSLAVNGDAVAVVWEDNRSGAPQAYLAMRTSDREVFSAPVQLSTGKEAYEPAIAAFANGFVAAWEQDGGVHVRAIDADGIGPLRRLSGARASQPTLHAAGDRLFAAWVERVGRYGQVQVAPLTVQDQRVDIGAHRAADARPPQDHQLYPSLAHVDDQLVLAWEDRRAGHTRLFYACAPMATLTFSTPGPLNEHPPPPSTEFGRGGGVTRVALAGNGKQVAAVWMDKRDFQSGYDIYAASLSKDCRFGANEKVQDLFGENTPQWHPAVAVARDGSMVAVWDDPRDGTPDLWLAKRGEEGWSDNIAVGPAHGPARQDNPMLAFDEKGRLHLAWLHASEGEAMRVMHAVATRAQP
ncbi:MAG: hypothetical protein M0R77_06795 [Gammaproteobacteria bacterium]|nr:hypothetical protein [Gammaproteobacteria bacterium]